jgi:hypothetical protein
VNTTLEGIISFVLARSAGWASDANQQWAGTWRERQGLQ